MIRLTRQQLRTIDRLAVEKYAMPSIVLMENASRNAADVAEALLRQRQLHDVTIVCGPGNNGGDGLATARHLRNRGFNVSILLTADEDRYRDDALINLRIIRAMKLPIAPVSVDAISNLRDHVIIDAIFGTGLDKPPRDPFGELAEAINASSCPVLAIDVPSGLDCDTGRPLGACIRADHTVTFVAEKVGFAQAPARQYTGQITVADIGCPVELIEEVARAG